MKVECGAALVPKMLTVQLAEEIDWLLLRIGEGRDLQTLERLAINVRRYLDDAPALTEAETTCPYEGEENVDVHSNEVRWTCPWCATEHVREIDEDPDLMNDLRADR